MALTAIEFDNVAFSYLSIEGEDSKKEKTSKIVTVHVERVSEEALVKCISSQGWYFLFPAFWDLLGFVISIPRSNCVRNTS